MGDNTHLHGFSHFYSFRCFSFSLLYIIFDLHPYLVGDAIKNHSWSVDWLVHWISCLDLFTCFFFLKIVLYRVCFSESRHGFNFVCQMHPLLFTCFRRQNRCPQLTISSWMYLRGCFYTDFINNANMDRLDLLRVGLSANCLVAWTCYAIWHVPSSSVWSYLVG